MTTFAPDALSRGDLTEIANGIIAPRPIAWVATIGHEGVPNLAPFSFFNCFSTAPFTIGIGPGSRLGVNKDSLRNIRESGEFTVSVVTESLADKANLTGADFEESVDEWAIAGLTPRASLTVRPPTVQESPAGLECAVLQIVDLGLDELPTNSLIVARVTQIHLDDSVLLAGTMAIDPDAIQLVGRMGGALWCRTRDRFLLNRPTPDEAVRTSAQLSFSRKPS